MILRHLPRRTTFMGLFYSLIIGCILLTSPSNAQETYQFKSGLVAADVHQYGREALYTDYLASQLYDGSLKKPAAGQTLAQVQSGKVLRWETIEANDENKFRGRSLRQGYLYLSYKSEKEQTALLHITSNNMVYVNGEPRAGDQYGYGYVYLPVKLKKGLNEFFVRGSTFSAYGGITAKLVFAEKAIFINTEDPTLPSIVVGDKSHGNLRGAVVIVNASEKPLKGLSIKSTLEGKDVVTTLPNVMPMSIRKVGFQLNPVDVIRKGKYNCALQLLEGSKVLDRREIKIEAFNADEDYSKTFVSAIDGSTQYYSVSPQTKPGVSPPSLFLSVHGAGVEAINQARAYKSKAEGVVITPTNRRPRGFNWEDWGRLDALEVLELAKEQVKPDPQRIYLTGHSMGGHGTWYLGATYPGKWAAIAPCAGYPTLAGYGSADGKIPDGEGKSATERLLLQASNASNVFELAKNYNAGGVYIHHGDSDKVVSVDYSRQMHQLLAGFHKDMGYHEQKGGSHWFSDESVDWQPIFDYFKWHTIPSDTLVKNIDFTTANTAISSKYHWASILQQEKTLQYSRIKLSRSDDLKAITGTTENSTILAFSLEGLNEGDALTMQLDDQNLSYTVRNGADVVYLQKINGNWQIAGKSDERHKGTQRNGTFKEPFNNRMVFVYGTKGTKEENAWALNKVRYDAESWYYRGNGSVDVVADKDFSPSAYSDRGVILYGNASTNSAYNKLLSDCPIKVGRGYIQSGNSRYTGSDLAAYFMWPRADSKIASVAVIGGTGLAGMHAADANQYFAGGSGFPDYLIFTSDLLSKGSKAIKESGFYGNDWKIESGQRIIQK